MGKKYTVKSFIIRTLHRILLGYTNQGG